MEPNAEQPLVTIITPTYKGEPYLEVLIESVRKQTYPHIEHLIIDDGSPDDGATVAILERYPHLRWWTRPNKGQYATLNEAFREAKGEIVTTINQDDFYVDERVVEDMVRAFRERPNADVVFGRTVFVDPKGERYPIDYHQKYPNWILPYYPYVYHDSLFLRRARMVEQDVWFDEKMRFMADADWMTRLYLKGLRWSRLDRDIAAFRHHDAQVTHEATASNKGNEAKAKERALYESRYCKSMLLRRLALMWATYHRRRLRIAYGLTHGGFGGVIRQLKGKAARKRSGRPYEV